jgi:2-C-methyl-D-erythritol 2,4-cyclodiphosphate synthase
MVSKCAMRVGTGFDVHRLVPDVPLKLGGASIPFHLGLEGHSDGDVLVHAVIDALLGASNLGDIGLMFPPDDPAIAGINSADMLSKVVDLLAENGYEVVNVDAVIICEEPKLSGHYQTICNSMGQLLKTDASRVSVKAKTAERLGEIGKGEAIAAQCVVLLAQS